jgi:hypothetical protein
VFGIVRPVGAAEYSGYPSTEEDEAAGQRAGGRPSTAAAGGGVSSDDGEESEVDVEELRERMARDPALRRRAYKQAMYQRRNTRTMLGNDSEEAETYAAAFAREFSHDIELTDVEDITRPDDYKKGTGDDPLEREYLIWAEAVCWQAAAQGATQAVCRAGQMRRASENQALRSRECYEREGA